MLFKRYPSDYQLKKRGKKRIFLELERRIMSISYADSYFARESDSELLILVRSQFRPQFLFWSGRKNKSRLFVRIETGFLLCQTDAKMVPLPFACLLLGFLSSSVIFLDIEIQANVDCYC